MFHYKGEIESSKSWVNRARIIQYYNPQIQINSQTAAKDVENLEGSLQSLRNGESEFYIGEGGTTLRFFSFLVSKLSGVWTLKCHPRLLRRPQDELERLLSQLGVSTHISGQEIIITSNGWTMPERIECDGRVSSQFVSGLLLNSWNLNRDLTLEIQRPLVSKEYLQMTLQLLKTVGLSFTIQETETHVVINVPNAQKPRTQVLQAEPDISSAFSLISAAVINGDVTITNWVPESFQPDLVFLNLFAKMNINSRVEGQQFIISKHNSWTAISANLVDAPDLFPVLSVLCALADGTSDLYGATQLKAKESDRIAKTQELLSECGFKTEIKEDGLVIYGKSSTAPLKNEIIFSPDHDHRMAMAAGLLKLAGFNIRILESEVVAKSYPDFWKHIQVNP